MAFFSSVPQRPSRHTHHAVPYMQYMAGIEYPSAPVRGPIPPFPPPPVHVSAPGESQVPIFTSPMYPANISELNVWDIYNQKAALADSDIISDFNSSMDVLLVFAGLFSAVNTAFIIETYKLLKPDQSEITNQLLYAVLGNQSTTPSSDFSTPDYAVRINTLLFASLITSLLTALAAMMVKQWAGYYDRGLSKISSKQIKARTRQYRHEGIQKWHLSEVVALVPMALHLSLLLFFIGIIDFLFAVHRTVAIIVTALVLCGLMLYATANVLPLIFSGAPFRSPITQVLEKLAQKVRRGLIPKLRSRMNTSEKAGDDAIEDPTDLWFGKDEPQARAVRLMRTLDIDAVTWLMVEADKITERYLLDMCFEKLMSLQYIAARNPSSFFRKEITRTYRQASNSCMNNKIMAILPTGLSRARILCRFLDWYLGLPRNEEQTRWLQDKLPLSEASLTQAYATYAHGVGDKEGFVLARIAYRQLVHLHSTKSIACGLCIRDVLFYDEFTALDPIEADQWMRTNASHVVRDLVSITTCIFSHPVEDDARMEYALQQAAAFIQAEDSPLQTFRPLIQALQSGKLSYPISGTRWRDALMALINRQQTLRAQMQTDATPTPMRNARVPRMRREQSQGWR